MSNVRKTISEIVQNHNGGKSNVALSCGTEWGMKSGVIETLHFLGYLGKLDNFHGHGRYEFEMTQEQKEKLKTLILSAP